MILREKASLQSLFFIFLVKLLQKQHSHRDDIVSVALVAAPPWPYRQRIVSRSIIQFPADGTFLSVVRSFPFFHISPSYNLNMAFTFFTVLSLTSASFAVLRIG